MGEPMTEKQSQLLDAYLEAVRVTRAAQTARKEADAAYDAVGRIRQVAIRAEEDAQTAAWFAMQKLGDSFGIEKAIS